MLSNGRAVAWVLATVAIPLAITWALMSVYLLFWYGRSGHDGPPPPEVIRSAVILMAAPGLWIAVGLVWCMHRRNYAFGELVATHTTGLRTDCMWGLALGLLWVAAYGLAGVAPFRDMFTLAAGKLASIPASVSAGVCEEFLFRGFVFFVITRAGGTVAHRLVWSSLAFALAHGAWGPWGMLWTTGLGLSFGAVRHLRGGVWPALTAHTVLNLCIEPALLEQVLAAG